MLVSSITKWDNKNRNGRLWNTSLNGLMLAVEDKDILAHKKFICNNDIFSLPKKIKYDLYKSKKRGSLG